MAKYEKLILLLVALVLFGRFSGMARDTYIANTYGAVEKIPASVELFWGRISLLLGLLVNIGAGIWLFIEAKSKGLRAWIWSLLGIFFGIIGLILFYAIQIYSTKSNNET